MAPLVAGAVSLVADGNTVTAVTTASGREVWRWHGPDWVAGMWRWRGLAVVLTGDGDVPGRLTGLTLATGAVRWTHPLPGGVYGKPAVTSDGGLVLAGGSGGLQLVNLSDGTVRWSVRTGPNGEAEPVVVTGGTGASDARAAGARGGAVVVAPAYSGSQLDGRWTRNGAVRWTVGDLPLRPVFAEIAGTLLVWENRPPARPDSILVAIDPVSGRVRWRLDTHRSAAGAALAQGAGLIEGTALPGGPGGLGVVAATTRPGRLWLLQLSDGRSRWSTAAPLESGTSLLVDGTNVLTFQAPDANVARSAGLNAAGQTMDSQSTATGARRWVRPIPRDVSGTAVAAGPDVVLQANGPDADLTGLLAYRAAGGQLAWRVTLPGPAWSAPVPVDGGMVVMAGGDRVFCDGAP